MNKELTKQVDPVIEAMGKIVINDQPSAVSAGEFLTKIKTTVKVIESFYDEDISEAHQAHKKLTTAKKFYIDKLKGAEKAVKDKMKAYQFEQERIRAAKEIEMNKKLQEQTEERKLEMAIETGDESILDRDVTMMKVEPPPIEAVDGISYATTWKHEVVDAYAVPPEFTMPDEKKIRDYVKLHKGKYPIAGVRIYEDKQVRVG